ncbi:hypothetical protein ZOSMA_42G00230 [Zostera marina]|uniref:Calmodulin-binding protein n=1 Tax=Zostera marina TaxID=29655 RepID=A0A0K9P417_ZOSMR|nr:hypothetical protein ZOSMA_42G00230 [Zostera marina]
MTDVMAISPPEFNFDSTCTTPYVSAPSSPRGFGNLYYTSAPNSPSSVAAFYSPFYSQDRAGDDHPEDENENNNEKEDFAFEFSGQLVMGADEDFTATADELFESGKIRPLKPSARLPPVSSLANDEPRGRERVKSLEKSTGREGSRRVTRSLSPLRGDHSTTKNTNGSTSFASTANSTTTVKTIKSMSSKKWKLMDFFLFRSASEGRVTDRNKKDPLQKYTAGFRATDQDAKNSNRSIDRGSVSSRRLVRRDGSESIGRSSRRGVTAHELHYASNRAQSEEMRKKTFLPYRQGLLGCLGFNSNLLGVSKGFGSLAGNQYK